MLLCLHLTNARLRTNEADQPSLSVLTDDLNQPTFDDPVPNDGKELSREESHGGLVADEFYNLSEEYTLPDKSPNHRDVNKKDLRVKRYHSCLKTLTLTKIPCREERVAIVTCRETSHACYKAIPKNFVKKCKPIYTLYPGCDQFYKTACECAV